MLACSVLLRHAKSMGFALGKLNRTIVTPGVREMFDPKDCKAAANSGVTAKSAVAVKVAETVMNGATAQIGVVNPAVLRRKDDLGLMQIRLNG
jgi:hypothetical protein